MNRKNSPTKRSGKKNHWKMKDQVTKVQTKWRPPRSIRVKIAHLIVYHVAERNWARYNTQKCHMHELFTRRKRVNVLPRNITMMHKHIYFSTASNNGIESPEVNADSPSKPPLLQCGSFNLSHIEKPSQTRWNGWFFLRFRLVHIRVGCYFMIWNVTDCYRTSFWCDICNVKTITTNYCSPSVLVKLWHYYFQFLSREWEKKKRGKCLSIEKCTFRQFNSCLFLTFSSSSRSWN